jgi:anthranilate phosphoribosyltransferase
MAPLLAAEMALRGRTALVFRGSDGLDELTTTGSSTIWVVFNGKVTEHSFDPGDLGIKYATVDQLLGGNAEDNALVARAIFGQDTGFVGEKAAIQDIVALNASAGITAYQMSKLRSVDDFDLKDSLAKNFAVANEAMIDGRALAKLNQWVEKTQTIGE